MPNEERMPTMTDEEISILVERLQKVAKKNRDEFRYNIEINVGRNGKISYRFVAKESEEGHEFITGCANTIDGAIEDAAGSVDESCKIWGYKCIRPEP